MNTGEERSAARQSGKRPSRTTPAVIRAFSILHVIRTSGPLSVADIASRLGLPRSTVHELVHTLVRLGAVAPSPDGENRFSLGLLLHELGSAYLSEVSLAREGQRVAESVATACGETVHLACLDGVEVVYIAKVDSVHTVRMVSAVGRRLQAHCTGVGKALLSGLSDGELDRRYGGNDARLPAMTPDSITSLAALKTELCEVRASGVAHDNCESNVDVRCIAAPVFDNQGRMVAAMSISVPTVRTGQEWPGRLADLVREGAAELSRRLGYRSPRDSGAERR